MTATYTDTTQPEPAAAIRKSWYRRPAVLIAAAAFTAAAVAGGITGTMLSGTVTGTVLHGTSQPADATAMVKADGYTTMTYTLPPAQITSDFGSAAPYVTSAAAGTDAAGNAEIGIYLTPQGMATLNSDAAVEGTTVSAVLGTAIPGATVTVSGGVIKVDAPASALSGLGS
jgi:hypothetical protein